MENNTPLLTLITINYNNAAGLALTLAAVERQVCSHPFEYLVIDGGSTDGFEEVIAPYVGNTVTRYISEKDRGVYHAMNKGTQMATGTYCLFLNSGDYLLAEDSLQRALDSLNGDDIQSFSCIIKKAGKTYEQSPPFEPTLFTFVQGSLPHPSTFIRRELLLRMGGYKESYRVISDWVFFMEALLVEHASYTLHPFPLSVFEADTGLSSTNAFNEGELRIKILRETFPRIAPDYFLEHKIPFFYQYRSFQLVNKDSSFVKLLLKAIYFVLYRLKRQDPAQNPGIRVRQLPAEDPIHRRIYGSP
ncbi:MAG: glycosyltransferase [Nitritalea sp.]